jgi:FAD:protein FMN transferase
MCLAGRTRRTPACYNPGMYRTRLRLFIALAQLMVVLSMAACSPPKPMERTVYDLLGTACMVRIYSGGSAAALDAAFARIREIDDRMTITREGSEVMKVNAAAGVSPVQVTPDVLEVVKRGLGYSEIGTGAFDITIAPLVRLWGIGTPASRVPAPAEIMAALSLVGWRDLAVDEQASTIFLRRAGMSLDLGSIAKGYAADEAARVLKGRGVKSALVDLGGNVLTMGTKPDGSAWRIGIQNPEEARGTKIGYVDITAGSVTTAGTYERYFERDGKRYFHILDARTGYPAWNGLSAVAVVAPDSITADGYDTLIFTLGLDGGRRFVAARNGAMEAVFITEKRQVYATPGLRGRFTLTDARFTLMP